MEEVIDDVIMKKEKLDDGDDNDNLENVVVKREKIDDPFNADFKAVGFGIFASFPDIPIREEHINSKRGRCVCMENSGLLHIANILKQIDSIAGALCISDVGDFISKLGDTFRRELSISKDEFEEKLRTLFFEIEEENIKNQKSNQKKKGKATQLQKLFSIQRQIRTAVNALKVLHKETRGCYESLSESQAIVNNKLAQIRVRGSEGKSLQTTEWPKWSFLDEKPKKKKQKL